MSKLNLVSDKVVSQMLESLSIKPIDQVEKQLLAQPQVECPVTHRFGPGTYIREISVPAGTLLMGHHHNFEQLNVLLKGRVTVVDSEGALKEVSAPLIYVGPPGRKIAYVHEDMVWINIHATKETDIEKIESHFVTKSEGWKLSEKERKGLEALKQIAENNEIKLEDSKCHG